MRTHETDERIVLQPETDVEQDILGQVFTRLNNLGENGGPHPTKIGSQLVFYTLDLTEYEDLDHDLWDEAECGVNEHGKLDPEPGSRGLVIVHNPSAHEGNEEAEGSPQEAIDGAVDGVEFDGVEDDDEKESGPELDDLMERISALVSSEDPDYTEMQGAAMDLTDFGIDVPANQTSEDLRASLEAVLDDYLGDEAEWAEVA